MEKTPMTLKGYNALQEELRHLKQVERPAVIQAISEAREHGDLSENAEYHSAREHQSFIEGRILELDDRIRRADIIDPARLDGDMVKFGATVTVEECDTGARKVYQIVGEFESDIDRELISYTSPLARGLIGKRPGDSFELLTPGGVREYGIVTVTFD